MHIKFINRCLRKCRRLVRAIKFPYQYICEPIRLNYIFFFLYFHNLIAQNSYMIQVHGLLNNVSYMMDSKLTLLY